MRFDVITLFPDIFNAIGDFGVSGRARQKGLWHLQTWNPRDFTQDAHRTVDDRPYGGGPGMVMMADPLEQAVNAAQQARLPAADTAQASGAPVILMSPTGRRFDQSVAQELSESEGAILVCGR